MHMYVTCIYIYIYIFLKNSDQSTKSFKKNNNNRLMVCFIICLAVITNQKFQ